MKKFEKVNQSNIFLYHVIEKLIFLQIHNILENPQISNMNSDFVPAFTVSQQREPIPYICDFSRGGLNTRLHTLVSKPCSEATNIGDRLSLLASIQLDKSEFICFNSGRTVKSITMKHKLPPITLDTGSAINTPLLPIWNM